MLLTPFKKKHTRKEYQILRLMLIGLIGEGQNFPQDQKTEKYFNKIIRQLLLMYYLYHTRQKE